MLGHSSVVSSGTDNSLGALLEHRHLSLSVRYIHMVVHSLIIQQAFTQYLSLCLVLGITVNKTDIIHVLMKLTVKSYTRKPAPKQNQG